MLELDVYTDAAGNINTKVEKGFGYSSVFYHNEVEYFSSFRISQEELQEILMVEEKISNPTVEVFAVMVFLSDFLANIEEHGSGEVLRDTKINIYSDYKGVSCWYNKEWAINKNYIRTLIRMIRGFAIHLKKYNIKFEIHWIKGHSGIVGNERADKLAVSRLNTTNLEQFFITINK